ncbi:MAG: ribonuclease Z [Candidatus Nanopusillus sp.]
MKKIVILGTSSSIPTESRNHPGIFIKFNKKGILLDCGENIQRQLRIMKISPTDIDYILITHWHGDHVLGLPGIFQSLSSMNYNKELNIIIPKENIKNLRRIIEDFIIPINFDISIIEAREGLIVDEEDFQIYGIMTKHSITSYSYYIIEKDYIKLDKNLLKKYNIKDKELIKKLKEGKEIEIDGKIISYKEIGHIKKGIKITYITDTIFFDKLIDFAKDSTILISESTYFFQPDLAKKNMHMDFLEVREIFNRSSSKILLLTHFSQRYEKEMENIRKDIEEKNENICILDDFDEINIYKNKVELKLKRKKIAYKYDEKTGEVLRLY